MIDLDFDIDKAVKQIQRQLGADIKEVKPALSATLNRMGSAIRMEGGNLLAKVMGITGAKLRKSTKLIKSRVVTLKARVWARGRPLNLSSFGGRNKRSNKRVVGVVAKPWGVQRTFQRGFVLNVPGKPIVIWKGNKLKSMYGPGVAKESQRQSMIKAYNKIAQKTFKKVFINQLKHRMSRKRRYS